MEMYTRQQKHKMLYKSGNSRAYANLCRWYWRGSFNATSKRARKKPRHQSPAGALRMTAFNNLEKILMF